MFMKGKKRKAITKGVAFLCAFVMIFTIGGKSVYAVSPQNEDASQNVYVQENADVSQNEDVQENFGASDSEAFSDNSGVSDSDLNDADASDDADAQNSEDLSDDADAQNSEDLSDDADAQDSEDLSDDADAQDSEDLSDNSDTQDSEDLSDDADVQEDADTADDADAQENVDALKNSDAKLVSAEGDIKIKLFVAAIDPELTSVDGKNYSNGAMKIKASEYLGFSLDKSLNFWCDNFEEISHNTVDFEVVDTVIIDEFPQYKSIDSLNNESFQEIFTKDAYGNGDWYGGISKEAFKPYDTGGDLDYDYYIDKLNLVNKKNAGEFDMVFLIGIDPLSPYETCMVGKNSFWINGNPIEADCDNFVIVTPTFSRMDGSIENIGHMAENMLGYTYGMIDYEKGCIDGSDVSKLNDWEKFCLCKYLATPETKVYGYGMVHFSPNSESDYDWSNNTAVKYYRDWQNSKDVYDFTADESYLNSHSKYAYSLYPEYDPDPCISHHRWWFGNMPYGDGRDEDGYYNSWWRYIFTPDYVTDLAWDKTLTDGEITLKVGEKVDVPFAAQFQSGKIVYTSTSQAEAPVVSKNEDIVSFKDGKIVGNKIGTGTIVVKLDGKSLEYAVTVERGKKYTINYELNGGTNNKENPSTYNLTATVTLKNPTKAGYTFAGWYDNAGFSGDKITKVKGKDITLFAKWTANTYTVTFNGNGGNYTPDGATKPLTTKKQESPLEYDKSAVLDANVFTRKGYTFAGWNTKADGKGKKYDNGASVLNLTKTNKGNVNLYAQWTANKYTVKFDRNATEYKTGDLSGEMAVINTSFNKKIKLPANKFIRKGYTFKGWATEADATKVKYKNKASVKNLASEEGAEVTLYAVWSVNTYNVKFVANGGKGKAPATIKGCQYGIIKAHLYEDVFTNKEVYSFAGWNTKKDGTGDYYNAGEDVDIVATKNNQTITLYAMWFYNINVYMGEGVENKTLYSFLYNYPNSTEYIESHLPELAKTGYYIAGFATSKKNADKGKMAYTKTVKNAAGKILYPVFKPIKYTVKFDKNIPEGAKVSGKMSNMSATYGKPFTLKANAFKCSGHKFLGWSTDKNATEPQFTNKAKVTENLSATNKDVITLYAIWQ